MQEIKVTDTYKCPLCGEKLIEVRLGVTNATSNVSSDLRYNSKDYSVIRQAAM